MSMNAHHCWGVITSNKEKADAVFANIEKEYKGHIVRKVFGNGRCYTEFDDGNDLVWIKLSNSARGYRFHRMWVDKDIDCQLLYKFLAPSFLYCKKEDVIWI